MRKIIKKFTEKKIGKFAREIFLKEKPFVIAITGSTAKTSTKDAVTAVLKEKFEEIFATPGNMNSEFGLPLSILGFSKSPRWYQFGLVIFSGWRVSKKKNNLGNIWILEMGSDKPGDIKYLTSIIKPDVAIVTTVGPSHLQSLKSIEGVYEEKANLVRALDDSGVAILNKNCQLVAKMAAETKAKIIFYEPAPDQIAQEAARAVGRLMNISEDKINEGLGKIKNSGGRMQILEGINDSVIIDDSYNSNPLSMEAALFYLEKIFIERKGKRKIAIVGDMLELGDFSKEAHVEVSEKIKKTVDYTVGIGPEMKVGGFNEWYLDSKEKMDILNKVRRGDIILVKGSRGIHLENVIKNLRK